jgi:hypothetical protein
MNGVLDFSEIGSLFKERRCYVCGCGFLHSAPCSRKRDYEDLTDDSDVIGGILLED